MILMDFSAAFDALKKAMPETELVQAGEGRLSGGFSSVSIDSRNVEGGALFIALKGEKTDGHRYLAPVFEKGASSALVTRKGMEEAGIGAGDLLRGKSGGLLFVVPDTLGALQVLSAAYLDQFPGLFRIGITGSSGKTTTKETAAAIIGNEKKTVTNSGNLNSETGLPLSIFTVRSDHEVGIFEAGMNHQGEMAALASVLRPSLALVTNVGSAHIGIIGSIEAIAEEKKQIFSRFTGNEKALVPESDPFTDFLSRGIRGTVVPYGQKNLEASGLLGVIHDCGLAGTEITWEGVPAVFGLPGQHNVRNALAAVSIAREIGLDGEAVRKGLASVKPLFGRGEVLYGKTTVLRDCYNANPASVAEALAFCDSLSWKGRRVYIMGSMLEQGDYSEKAHEDMGRLLAASKAGMVFLYGKETAPAAEVLAAGKLPWFYTDTMDELKKAVSDGIRPGDLVLLKGSRGCALEELSGAVLMEGAD